MLLIASMTPLSAIRLWPDIHTYLIKKWLNAIDNEVRYFLTSIERTINALKARIAALLSKWIVISMKKAVNLSLTTAMSA